MSTFLKSKRGFSLVEMLIVVSIIGMLSAFVAHSLTKSRPKARLASAQAQMGSLHPYLVMCINDGQDVDWDEIVPTVTTKICLQANDIAVFQKLPSHWEYVLASGPDKFKAKSDEGNFWEIECSETGCVTTVPTP